MKVKILVDSGRIEYKNITPQKWRDVHYDVSKYKSWNGKKSYEDFYQVKKHFDFLKRHKLEPTIFNLNCIRLFEGVILTDLQISKRTLIEGKDGR